MYVVILVLFALLVAFMVTFIKAKQSESSSQSIDGDTSGSNVRQSWIQTPKYLEKYESRISDDRERVVKFGSSAISAGVGDSTAKWVLKAIRELNELAVMVHSSGDRQKVTDELESRLTGLENQLSSLESKLSNLSETDSVKALQSETKRLESILDSINDEKTNA